MVKIERPKTDSRSGTSGDNDEPKFRLRPRPARVGSRGDIGWSVALTTVFRYASTSAKLRKAASQRLSGSQPRRPYNQRCAVRVTYSPNKTTGQWRAHGIYIARESAAGQRGSGFGLEAPEKDIAAKLNSWQSAGDERIWKVILSPEFGERVDLEQMTREVMKRAEKEIGTPLEWVAVSHFNTEHPHVHLVIRGRRDDGRPLNLDRDFVKHGLRSLAEDACTLQLGPRTELDAAAAAEREIKERRYTSLDRTLERRAFENEDEPNQFRVKLIAGVNLHSLGNVREQHLQSRLLALREMGLANPTSDQHEWLVRKDFSTVLRAMQLASDRQKMLASNGSLVSDQRLQLSVLDLRRASEVQGRVLTHGEEERGSGTARHYLLLEGTDARIHMIFYTLEMEAARSAGHLKPNSFVRFKRRNWANQRTIEITDLGDANVLLKDRSFLQSTVKKLAQRGVFPSEEGWGGWLGRYQSAVCKTSLSLHRSNTRSRDR